MNYKFIIKLMVTIILVYFVINTLNIELLINKLLTIDFWYIFSALLLTISLLIIQSIRWTTILLASEYSIAKKLAASYILIGHFFNQVLPSSVGGDAVKIWKIKRLGVSGSAAFNSVVIDRLSALFVLLLISIILMPWLFVIVDNQITRYSYVVLLGGAFFSFLVIILFKRLPNRFFKWRATKLLELLSLLTLKIASNKKYVLPVIIVSVFIHVMVALSVYLIALSINLPIEFIHCLVLVPPVILITMIPVTIAGWGLREGAMVVAFGHVDVSSNDAFLLSVLFGIVLLLAGIPGCILWLIEKRHRNINISEINELTTTSE